MKEFAFKINCFFISVKIVIFIHPGLGSYWTMPYVKRHCKHAETVTDKLPVNHCRQSITLVSGDTLCGKIFLRRDS